MRHFISFISIALLLISISVIDVAAVFAQDQVIRAPETLESAKEGVLNIGDKVMQGIPHAIGRAWEEQVLPIWQKMWQWTKEDAWQKRISPALQTIGDKAKSILGPEVTKRKEIAQERLKEQKEDYATHSGRGKAMLEGQLLFLSIVRAIADVLALPAEQFKQNLQQAEVFGM